MAVSTPGSSKEALGGPTHEDTEPSEADEGKGQTQWHGRALARPNGRAEAVHPGPGMGTGGGRWQAARPRWRQVGETDADYRHSSKKPSRSARTQSARGEAEVGDGSRGRGGAMVVRNKADKLQHGHWRTNIRSLKGWSEVSSGAEKGYLHNHTISAKVEVPALGPCMLPSPFTLPSSVTIFVGFGSVHLGISI